MTKEKALRMINEYLSEDYISAEWVECLKLCKEVLVENEHQKTENHIISFTVPLPPVSKKNSMRIVSNLKTGKPFLIASKAYKDYEEQAMFFIPKSRKPIDFPVNVDCKFYMPTKRKCDVVNMQEAILDVMVKAGLLADDNYSIVRSMDGSRVLYDKNRARTEVTITQYLDEN